MPLHQIADVRSGVAKGKTGLKDPISVPYLRVANVQDGHINLDEVKEIEIERHQLERFSLLSGDVLMNEGGDFDKLGRGDVWLGQITPCVHQNHVFSVRPDQERLNSFFLAALAASHYGKSYFLSCAKRSTNLASINSTQIKEFPVLTPPIAEQKKITQILSTWDKAITTTEKLLANSERQKKALMQQLLTGKRRLLDENGVRFKGKWKSTQLKQLVNIIYGKSPKEILSDDGQIPVYGTGGVAGYSKKSLCSTTSVLIGRKGTIDRPVFIDAPFWAIDTTFYCLAKAEIIMKWFYYAMSVVKLRKYSEASGVPSLSRETLYRIKILAPANIQEQEAISKVLTIAEKEVSLLQKKIDVLKLEKKALMQQLLTGKRRVNIGSNI